MKIIVLTDVHANLPALEAALQTIQKIGYDALFHLGDAISIGPFPAECLDLLLNTPRSHFIMGNHDAYFAHGLPQPQPARMSDGELAHQGWTHAQLDPQLRAVVSQWPYRLQEEFAGVPTSFLHYGLDASGRNWQAIVREATAVDLDRLFANETARLVFYGHHHPFAETAGRACYVNPGSLGCYHLPLARFTVVDYHQSGFSLSHQAVPYADEALFREFAARRVPDRDFIDRAFFGGRLGNGR